MEGGKDNNACVMTIVHKHVLWATMAHAYIWKVERITMHA